MVFLDLPSSRLEYCSSIKKRKEKRKRKEKEKDWDAVRDGNRRGRRGNNGGRPEY